MGFHIPESIEFGSKTIVFIVQLIVCNAHPVDLKTQLIHNIPKGGELVQLPTLMDHVRAEEEGEDKGYHGCRCGGRRTTRRRCQKVLHQQHRQTHKECG
jgi:hypothetical protein